MINRIEITSKISNNKTVEAYTIVKKLNEKQLNEIASSLINPVYQTFKINYPTSIEKMNWAVEIGFLPGVTDNVATTTKEIIEDKLKIKFIEGEGVYTSKLFFTKDYPKNNLINPLIQRIHIKSKQQYLKDKGMDRIAPQVNLVSESKVGIIDLNVSDDELIKISKTGTLALDLSYMKTIQGHFKKLGRNPTDIELETIAQTWSEHCKHTIFADPIDEIRDGIFKTYIKKSTEEIIKKKKRFCYSVFTDNSGAIEFNKDFLITHKVETHNSPSALDPYGGAITGIVGVNRDTIGFGMGAKPVINLYGFCFANPDLKNIIYRDKEKKQPMLSPRRIINGVIKGVNSGGNCSGIPTPQGFVYFDDSYQGKPLIFVGTVGLIPKKINSKSSCIKKAEVGDLIVMVGGRVGQDGIHGATFSSEALSSGSPATAVQIGDPITQKKLSDAIIKEARDQNLYHSITDNGAGGLSCSVAEMAKESGGCLVELDKVPLKYPGLPPWKIWISESQERMTLAISKKNWTAFEKLMISRGVEATVIGIFNNTGCCVVKFHQKTIVDIDMEFLHDGLPVRPMKTKKPIVTLKTSSPLIKTNLNQSMLSMLKQLNITSFEFIPKQYDHEVQAGSVIKPIQGKGRVTGETSITKPILNSNYGVALSQGLYPRYSEIDCYQMAACSIDTAIRNLVAAGVDINKIALLDNFCWCSSKEPERLYQLKQAAKACYDLTVAYETPLISGKDSMFNDFSGFDEKGKSIKISVLPTLLISSIGVVNNIYKTISIDTKFPDDLIYVLGETSDEMGGSEYFNLNKKVSDHLPPVDINKNKKLYENFYQAAQKNLISSSISLTRGGLGIGLAKMSIAGKLGIKVSLKNLSKKLIRDDYSLFSESQGRILVTINPKNKKIFEKTFKNNYFKLIGKVTKDSKLVISGSNNKTLVNLNIDKIEKAYKLTFKNF